MPMNAVRHAVEAAEAKKLFAAAKNGDTACFKRSSAINPFLKNGQGETACHVALREGRLQWASLMAAHYPTILGQTNAVGDPVLHYALRMGRLVEFIKPLQSKAPAELLDQMREIVDSEGKSLVYMAAENGDVEAVRTLMALPASTRTPGLRTDGPNGSSALHVAIRERKYDVTQILLQHKPDLSLCQDGNGYTPLHLAVMLNDPKLLDLLIRETPQLELVDVRSKNGSTLLHLAASRNNLEIFQLLLTLCPKCYLYKTVRDQNVLHLAVQAKAAEIVEFIVKNRKMIEHMINEQDNEGNTPLHIAASDDNKKMLNILLTSPVTMQPLKNKEGHTFLDVAKAQASRKKREKQHKVITATQSFHSSLLVVATLITTVTFTAAFTMPGGYKSDGDDQGVATLAGRAAFRVFIVADAISMCSSIIATITLVLSSVITATQKKFLTLMVAISSIVVSIIFMLLAFTSGVWVVIPKRKWLAIIIAVVTSCAPLVLLVTFSFIAIPSESEDEEVALETLGAV